MSRTFVILAAVIALTIIIVLVMALTGGLTHRDRMSSYDSIQKRAWKSCYKIAMQHMRYEQAAQRARAEGRLLVVIGNPSGGWVNQTATVYGCGDVCIDMKGCEPCPPRTRVLKQDVLDALKTLPSDSAVVFESEVLEYVDDFPAVLAELARVTGNDRSRVYAVHTIGIQDSAWEYHTGGGPPDPPTEKYLKERREDRWKYHKSLGEGLAKRVIYRYPPRDGFAWSEL